MHLPPKSILTNASAIVSACEWAEVSPDCGNNIHSPQPLKFVLVTELAALLHLESYTHARNLWHRHRQNVNSITNTNDVVDPEMDQFQRLWNAAQPLLLASASSSSTINTSNNHSQSSPSSSLKIQTSRRQFYDQLRSSCIQTTHTTQQQPLATFANELIQSQRMHMVQLLEHTFDSIPRSKPDTTTPSSTTTTSTSCRLTDVLGFQTRIELEEFLMKRDWQLMDDGFWIPGETYLHEQQTTDKVVNNVESPPSSSTVPSNNNTDPFGFGLLDIEPNRQLDGRKSSSDSSMVAVSSTSSWKDEKIHFLTHVVGFMERQGLDMTAPREGGK